MRSNIERSLREIRFYKLDFITCSLGSIRSNRSLWYNIIRGLFDPINNLANVYLCQVLTDHRHGASIHSTRPSLRCLEAFFISGGSQQIFGLSTLTLQYTLIALQISQ